MQNSPFDFGEGIRDVTGDADELSGLFDDRDEAEYELCEWGVLAEIAQFITRPGGESHIVLNGISRARVRDITQDDPFIVAQIEIVKEPQHPAEETSLAMAALVSQVESYINMLPHVPNEVLDMIRSVDE